MFEQPATNPPLQMEISWLSPAASVVAFAILAMAFLVPFKRLWVTIAAGASELIVLAIAVLSLPDEQSRLPLSIIGTFAIFAVNVLRYRESREDARQTRMMHAKLAEQEHALRSELRERVSNMHSALLGSAVKANWARLNPAESDPWNRNWVTAEKEVREEYWRNYPGITRILCDLETCKVDVPPEIRRLSEDKALYDDEVDKLLHFMQESMKALSPKSTLGDEPPNSRRRNTHFAFLRHIYRPVSIPRS